MLTDAKSDANSDANRQMLTNYLIGNMGHYEETCEVR